MHGSGGNLSKGTRRTYVIAFRAAETVRAERAAGFTHSHNDSVNCESAHAATLRAATRDPQSRTRSTPHLTRTGDVFNKW